MITLKITCDGCGVQVLYAEPGPMTVGKKIKIYQEHGWVFLHDSSKDPAGKAYCPNCTPAKLRPISGRHPHYYDYYDSWGNPPEKAS